MSAVVEGYDDTLLESSVKVRVAQEAVQQGLVSADQPVAMFINTTQLAQTVTSVKTAFSSNFVHTFAAKANPLLQVLRQLRAAGMGCEAASLGELCQALRAGFPPDRIVFDSPAKTMGELRFALSQGVNLNIDNLQELERVTTVRMNPSDHLTGRQLIDSGLYKKKHGTIGVRVNPQVGTGTIVQMSTAGKQSKFGMGMEDLGDELLKAIRARPWITSMHCHVGSQGCPLELIGAGVRRMVDLALQVNKEVGKQQIRTLNIGGGLPVNFKSEEITPTFNEYAAMLRQHVPELFSGQFRVFTEFGRSIAAKAGFFLARVEYTKISGGKYYATVQAGADLCVRTVYMPDKWPLRVTALTADGKPKLGQKMVQDVVGPCCFSGDVLAHGRLLPFLVPGDYVMLHDTGAYYYSAFSRYNMRQAPGVYGFEESAPHKLRVLRAEETVHHVMEFFSKRSKL